jgi:DNA-binding PadR family transcriptional regulator
MQTLTPIEWQVLRLTAGEPENLEQIHDQLRNPPWKAPLADAADAVRSLVEKGILAPRAEDADEVSRIWKATFAPTTEGREVLAEGRPSPPPGWPEGRIYPGIFKGLVPSVTREDIDEIRREMWANFPRDFPT